MSSRKIKTIVVEDEILLLKNIAKKISRVNSTFEVVGSAYNGKEALELIEKEKPDVVFTDIRMPLMDGLQLAETVQNIYPSVAVVIVSGYSDFEYARSAIRFGVCNYLLKPVREQELAEVLEELEEKILTQSSQKTREIVENQLFYGKKEVGESYRYLKDKKFGIFLICIGNLNIRNKKSNGEIGQHMDWEEITRKLPGNEENVYVFKEEPNQWIVLLEGKQEEWTAVEACLRSRISGQASTVNIAYTKNSVAWSELNQGWQQVRRDLLRYFVIGESQSFSGENMKMEATPAVLAAMTVKHFQRVLHFGNTEEIRGLVLQLFAEWKKEKMTQQRIEKMLHQILILFQQNLFFSEEDYDTMFQNVFGYLEEDTELLHAAEKIAEELSKWGKQKQAVPSEIEEAIEQMDDYIRKHYVEAINLSELSEKFHFNHSYMTRLFKKLKGQTPMKLINTLRMADAKEMLINSSLSIREISEALGFTDQHYFSRNFKDTVGITPKEYRTERQRQI